MLEANFPIFTAVTMTGTIHSTPIFLDFQTMCSIQAVWSGTPAGNFIVETSNDVGAIEPDGTVTGLSHWDIYTSSTQAAGGTAGSFTWRITPAPDRWMRLSFTNSGSTGVVSARANVKTYG